MKLRGKEEKKKKERENNEVAKNNEKRVKPQERKKSQNWAFFAKEDEIKRALVENQPFILLVYKEPFLNFEETSEPLHSLAIYLLQKF